MSQIKNTHILVVEDNENMKKLMVSILNKVGFEKVSGAENGKVAWDMIQTDHYGLVLTDLMMPEMDGLELLEQIRTSSDPLKNVPVLMITASDQKSHITQAVKLKINGYIVKPFNVKTILSKIKEAIGQTPANDIH